MDYLKHFYALVERFFGLFLIIFSVIVVLMLTGLVFVIIAEVAILYHLVDGFAVIFTSEHPVIGNIVFLLLELVDLTLVSVLIVIIATTAFNMIFEMTGQKTENAKKGGNSIVLSGPVSMNLEAKLIFSLIGLSAVAILGTIYELSSRIEKGEFYYETIPLEYYLFGGGYLLLIVTSMAVIILSKADKE